MKKPAASMKSVITKPKQSRRASTRPAVKKPAAAPVLGFFDPHFHIWDVSESTWSGHDAAILFKPGGKDTYLRADYEAEFDAMPRELSHEGGVFLEALSVCHVGMSGPQYSAHCMEEAKFAKYSLASSGEVSYVLVPTCALEQSDAKEQLRELSKEPTMRGIRQILNYEPSWPRNGNLGDLLDNPLWQQGFDHLEEVGFSFDMQLNPHQFAKAARFLAGRPKTTVIINHLGSPTLSDLEERSDQYWSGMEALAKLPNTYVKISMLCYAALDWDKNEVVIDAVHKVIRLFGAERCMFASNYPVDAKDGWTAGRLFKAFLQLASRYTLEERKHLFALSARRAYRC
eukprot:TRINITY_DN72679_c0_g1_i1.p1 TRINITY_DN72679_c0_g1~~TRINITY_DN72679_c0_g1_i1.p1  ORF type:complete len:343 (+),score=57.13 TRINITY_DN72679_c0_g1_i1:76-1104(+)